MGIKSKIGLIWIIVASLGIIVYVQLVTLSDKQKQLASLTELESRLDEKIEEDTIILSEISTEEYKILLARKRGFGYKNDRRFVGTESSFFYLTKLI